LFAGKIYKGIDDQSRSIAIAPIQLKTFQAFNKAASNDQTRDAFYWND